MVRWREYCVITSRGVDFRHLSRLLVRYNCSDIFELYTAIAPGHETVGNSVRGVLVSNHSYTAPTWTFDRLNFEWLECDIFAFYFLLLLLISEWSDIISIIDTGVNFFLLLLALLLFLLLFLGMHWYHNEDWFRTLTYIFVGQLVEVIWAPSKQTSIF